MCAEEGVLRQLRSQRSRQLLPQAGIGFADVTVKDAVQQLVDRGFWTQSASLQVGRQVSNHVLHFRRTSGLRGRFSK